MTGRAGGREESPPFQGGEFWLSPKVSPLHPRKQVAELGFFCTEVIPGAGGWIDFDWHAFLDLDTGADERVKLPGIIRHQADALNSENAENFRA